MALFPIFLLPCFGYFTGLHTISFLERTKMSISFNSVNAKLAKYTTIPIVTLLYLTLTVTLSAITSYIRTQSYNSLIVNNPDLVFDDIVIPSLQLVPSHFVFHPWSLTTTAFVETSPFQFLCGLVIIYFGITFLESQWDPRATTEESMDDIEQYLKSQGPIPETIKFTSFIIIISNFICLLLTSLIHIINGNSVQLNSPLQYGLFILILPISIVAKQLLPETNIKVLSLFKFRFKRLPFILLLASMILSMIKLSLSPVLPGVVSFFVAWYYLRYIQISPAMNGTILPVSGGSSLNSDTIRGDPSDTFALVEFFPDVLKPTLRPLFEGFYQLSVLLAIVRPWNDDDVDIGNLRSNLRVSGPSLANKRTNSSTFMNTTGNSKNLKSETDDEIAERRKQIALKVLEETANKK